MEEIMLVAAFAALVLLAGSELVRLAGARAFEPIPVRASARRRVNR